MKIAVIGAGSWGTTLAILLAGKGYDVRLWARREELARDMESKKENAQYLPGVKFPDSLIAESSIKNVVEGTGMIVSAVPSQFLRETLESAKSHYSGQIVVSLTKGFEQSTGRRMSEVIADVLGKNSKVAVLSGP